MDYYSDGTPVVPEYEAHENLSGLLGGDDNGHYHLTREQLDWLITHMEEQQRPVIHGGQEIVINPGEEINYQIESDKTKNI